jgi:hypothetical protein
MLSFQDSLDFWLKKVFSCILLDFLFEEKIFLNLKYEHEESEEKGQKCSYFNVLRKRKTLQKLHLSLFEDHLSLFLPRA